MIVVRAATLADDAVLVAMGRKFYESLPYEDVEYCEASAARWLQLMRDQGVLLVAELDGVAVGMAGGIFAPFIFNDAHRVGMEVMWWIEEEHRHAGIGRALLEALERSAYAAHCIRWSMIAVVDGSEDRVGKLYELAGYDHAERTYTKRAPSWPR